MKNYYRIYLGKGNCYAEQGHKEGFIGVDFGFDFDLSKELQKAKGNWKKFNSLMIPKYLEMYPDKTKIGAGLACGMTHTVCDGLNKSDIVLVPDGDGEYYVGEVSGDYTFVPNEVIPHRRPVQWYSKRLNRDVLSEKLKNSMGSVGTISNISKHGEEIENLLNGLQKVEIISQNEEIEDATEFVLEKHLEDFLIANWENTDLGKHFDIYEVEGEMIGQQFPTDTGPIDILAISKDKKELLVVELKKGRTSDAVVGQIQRYMGYVQSELAEEDQTVKGVIIALKKDLRLERALSITQNIEFYKYEVKFRLIS